MDNHAVVDQIVQSLSFEVEAVPKHKTVEITSASKSTPLNVKIRVRKKDDLSMRRGVISIPKFDDPESIPQKIRLVNSDQTIMSFDVFMEAEFEKTSQRKRKNIFDMLKPGICLGASDDDDYPYMPSSSYSANVNEDNPNSRSDGVLKHNFTLSKNTYDQYGDPTKGKNFLGKCKPGGCLDPPFGEDKYSYKPVIRKPFSNEENTIKKENVQDSATKFKGRRSSVFDSGIFKKKRKTSDQSTGTRGSSSIKGNQSNSILNLYQVESTVNSLSTTQSNSIITYPPALTSSELPISDERNRSRVSSEDKSRKSFNEFTETYFIPPKGINKMKEKKNTVKSDTSDNTSKLQETDKEKKKTKPIDTLKVPMPIPIPVPIPIKSETVKHETVAPDVAKLDPKSNKDKIISAVVDPSRADYSHPEIGKDDNVMEAKCVNIGNFDKIKQDAPSDTDSEHIDSSAITKIQQHAPKHEEKGFPNKNASIEGPHIKQSPEHLPKQEEKGSPNKNASIEGSQTKDSPPYSSKQKEEGSPNKNASIKESHTKDSPPYSSEQRERGLPNNDASIEGPNIKHSPEYLSMHEEAGSPNKNTSIEGSHTKDSPQYSSKQKEGGLLHKNASIKESHIKHSPQHLPKQEEGLPNKNASIEGPHIKHGQEEEESPNKNAAIEEPHIKQRLKDSPKQEEEGLPNKNVSTVGSHTKDSIPYSSKQKEGVPNKNASIEGARIQHSPQHLPKQEEEGLPNKNASIEGSHTKDSLHYSSKQKEGGVPNKNASIEGPRIEHSPQHLPKQEEEGLPNKNTSIEGSHKKDSLPYSSKQKEGGVPIKNASFEGPNIKDRSQHLSNHEEGLTNKNDSIEEPHTKASPPYSSKQKDGGSLNTNSLIVDPLRKNSLQYSSKLEKEGPPNKNTSIDGIHTKDSSQYSPKTRQEKQDSLKPELSKHELFELTIPPKEDYVEIIDTADKTDSIINHKDETQSNILFPRKYTQEKPFDPTQELDLKEEGNENKNTVTQYKEDSIYLNISESKFSQKSRSLSEPEIYKRQDLDSSYISQNDADNVPILNDIKESKIIKVGENDSIKFRSHNDNKVLESYDAGNDFSSAHRSSQNDRPIKDDSSIKNQQLQSPKDTENTGLSTEEMVNENRNYTSELAISDVGFRKLGSVNSETNLFDEHGIDIKNKKPTYEDEKQWKAALRTGGTELEDDNNCSASPSIIKSTKDKGVISPEKRVVIPMYHTGSTDTITKTGETRDEFRYPSNELDKKVSNIKSYVGSASVSSSIPSVAVETVAVDLAFQSYLNEKNERVLKTFDTIAEPKRYVNDSITLVKSQVRLSANEIRIPVDSENDMIIQIKKASLNQHVHISESELQTGIGWYNIKYCLVFALFLVAAIVEPVGYSFVLPAAICDLEMTDSQRGFIASIPYIGIVVTSYPWGYLVDTRGRKPMILFSSLAAGAFGILAAFMPNLITFALCKFLNAFCIACPAAVPYTFIGEMLPHRYRDIVLSVVNAMQITGSALVPLLAWAILPIDFRIDFGAYIFRPWRLLTILYSSFFIIAAILMSFGPESPKYLVSQGRLDEALQVVKVIYAGNKRKSPDEYPIKKLTAPPNNREKGSFLTSLKVQTVPIFKPPYLKWLCLNGFLLFGIFSVLNGLYMWVPDVLNRVLTGDGGGKTACEVIFDRLNQTSTENAVCVDTIDPITYVINTVANVSCAVIALAVSSTVKFIGKKRLLVVLYTLIGTFCILINFITQDMLFAVLLSSIPIMGLAIGPVNAYSVEIFPTHLRGMAVSITMMIGRSGSIVGTNIAGVLLNAACEATFYLFGGLLLVCTLLTFLLPNSRGPPNKPQKMHITRL